MPMAREVARSGRRQGQRGRLNGKGERDGEVTGKQVYDAGWKKSSLQWQDGGCDVCLTIKYGRGGG